MRCARTWRWAKTRPQVGQSSGPVPLSPSQSCLGRSWRVASAAGRDALKISFECSILYRLLLLMGARFLRSSRCRKATGLSIQLTQRNPSGCPLSSLRNMSGERNPHAITSNPARRIDYSSSCRGPSSDVQQQRSSASPGAAGHLAKNRQGDGGEECDYRRRDRACSHLRR